MIENDKKEDDKAVGENNQAEFGLNLKNNQMREIVVENDEKNIALKAKNRSNPVWNGMTTDPFGWPFYKYHLQGSQLDSKDEFF